MWPKALASLIELLPHLTRLVPMADKFLSSKTADVAANTRAMEAMADGLRGDLGQVTASHAGLYRQMNELDGKLNEAAAEVRAMRADVASLHAEAEAAERRQRTILMMLTVVIVLGVICVVMLVMNHRGIVAHG